MSVVQKKYAMLFFYIFFLSQRMIELLIDFTKIFILQLCTCILAYKIKIVEIKIIEKVNGREINSLSNKL